MFDLHNKIDFDYWIIGSFGRRASDGGANLQIFYTTSGSNGQSIEPIYGNQATTPNDLRMGIDAMQQQHVDNSMPLECGDESNDEIQRWD